MTVDLKKLLKLRVEKTRDMWPGNRRIKVIEKQIIKSVPLDKKESQPQTR